MAVGVSCGGLLTCETHCRTLEPACTHRDFPITIAPAMKRFSARLATALDSRFAVPDWVRIGGAAGVHVHDHLRLARDHAGVAPAEERAKQKEASIETEG